MKIMKKPRILRCSLVACLLMHAASIVNAEVTLTLNNPNNGSPNSDYSSYAGLNAKLNGVADINGGEWIGIYSFSVSANPIPNVTSPYYSICLSPGGNLDANTHSYTQMTPPAPGSEVNPGNWSPGGFQNAAFLFNTFQPTILKGTSGLPGSNPADQGTALAMAIYSALWNSTAVGVVSPNGTATTGFYMSGGGYANSGLGNSNQYADYETMMKDITANGVNAAPSATVLVPDNPNGPGSGQEFMLIGGQVQGGTVPEPSTVIAGLLMLLPFGGGLIRKMRKKAD
jgi:hypothetical protein